jgi:hypothetical protein
MTKKRAFAITATLATIVIGWGFVNPNAMFGISRFGLTTYSRIPIPILDVRVRQDGAIRLAFKSHDLGRNRLTWLVEGPTPPEVLVVGVGWEESAHVSTDFKPPLGTRVEALPTPDALLRFNALRAQGVRVAIYVHSTC